MSNYTIEKTTRHGHARLNERLHIKAFKYSDDMHKFLNKQCDNTWSISNKTLKAGQYVFAGGEYRNIKTIDPSALAHM